jgi:signal transduction histidine kinase
LINDILDLSKVEAGELKLRDQDVHVCDVLTACQRLVQQRAEKAGVTLSISCPVDLPKLRGDKLKLKQIFLNLLSNAIKFTPENGRVNASAHRPPDGGIQVSVTDTGVGISEDNLSMVLEPFQQISGPMSQKYEGTGLGLPLVKGLVELHGGHLWLESIEGEGTKATIYLPAERVIEAPAQLPCVE